MPTCVRARLVTSLLIVFTFSFAAPAALYGQQPIAISGQVRDGSGGVLPGAAVEIVAAGQRFAHAVSDAEGRYRIDAPAGVPIELRVELAGFAQHVVALAGRSQPLNRDVVLAVAAVSDTLIVTAARSPLSRVAVTESVTAFAQRDLRALGSTSLADVLRYVPAVNIESTGRDGAVTSMFSRGGESDYNLVLIDGVRVNQSGGTFDFSRIAAADIDRVEVVRGAQSSLWGSDAMGSVVQVFTRRGAPGAGPRAEASFDGGSFGAFRGSARLAGGAGRAADYHVGVSHRETSGAFDELLPEDDAFEQDSVDAGAGVLLGGRVAVRGGVRYTEAKGKSVGQITFGARDRGTGYDTDEASGYVSVTHAMGSRLTGAAAFNLFDYRSRSFDSIADPAFSTYAILTGTPNALFPNGTRLVRLIGEAEFNALAAAGAAPGPGQFLASRQTFDFPFANVTEFERPAFRYQADYTTGRGRLSGGYEWERESNPLTETFRLDNHAAFVQQQLSIGDRWSITAGVRIDSKDSYDTFVSPKLSAGGFLIRFRSGALSSLKLFGNLGKGIKSPTFSERFGGSFADPSPGLKVERARTGDAGLEATFADQRFFARVAYFNNDYLDQIAFRSGVAGDGIPEFINIDGSTADGWEVEWALQRAAGGVTAAASYAYVDHRVVTNLSTSQQFQPGQPLLRRPRHAGSVRASWVRGRVTVNADARLVGDRHDHSFLSLRTVPNAQMPAALTTDITVNPGYTVIGAGVELAAHDRLSLFVRGSNVGDAEYDAVLGYPALPRAVTVGARVRFGVR